MRLDQGGHLTHGSPVSISGNTYHFVAYGVTPANDDGTGERIDFDQVRDLAMRERPRLIVAGTTAYTRIIDPLPFRELADSLGAEGFRLVAGGTENHQVILDLRSFDADLNGKLAQETLDRAGITCNRNTIPDDPRTPFITSGLRLGSAAETTAGMGVAEMAMIGSLIGRVLRAPGDEATISTVRTEVRELCLAFDPY